MATAEMDDSTNHHLHRPELRPVLSTSEYDPVEAEEIRKEMKGRPRVHALPLHQCKTVYFIRHAEAMHNEAFKTRGRAAYSDPQFLDPALTPNGRSQCCERLRPLLNPKVHSIELVVISPLKRTLETAHLAMDKVPHVPWLAHELVRERIGANNCDRRGPRSVAAEEFPLVDFSLVEDEEDLIWTQDHRETKLEMVRRGVEFLNWLQNRPEQTIAVVTHSAFLLVLFKEVLHCDCAPELKEGYENAEVRAVTLRFGR